MPGFVIVIGTVFSNLLLYGVYGAILHATIFMCVCEDETGGPLLYKY